MTNTEKTSKVMAQTIASLGLSNPRRNALVKYTMRNKNPKFRFSDFGFNIKKWRKILEQLAGEVTVKDVINAWNSTIHPGQTAQNRKHNSFTAMRAFMKRVAELGLTKLDWVALPATTIPNPKLRLERLTKEELLKQSILILDTLSWDAIRYLEDILKKNAPDITIGELLSAPFFPYGWCYKDSVSKTRRKLFELGLDYEDGFFLQADTKRQLTESLVAEEGIDQNMATTAIEIAQRHGWIRPFKE